jgi:mono/diheme cytochrome c family protein
MPKPANQSSMRWSLWCAFTFLVLLSGCTDSPPDPPTTAAKPAKAPSQSVARWYDSAQASRGEPLFARHCAGCHGKGGEGAFGWRRGVLPPPLNGSGHAWHHPLRALGYQIKFGTPGEQGKMPGFAHALSDAQILDVIAWFQSQWPEELYAAWARRDAESRQKKP